MKKVVIAQHRLLHYRTEFFQRLRDQCGRFEIELHLLHGQPTRREVVKKDSSQLPWADEVTNHYLEFGSRDILWQPIPSHLRDADLMIFMQENRLISNYPRIFGWTGGSTRKAFWGHGRNFQAETRFSIRERWKRSYIGSVDWWFAYTSLTRDILLADKYPDSRITVLNNAIDNEGFTKDLSSVDANHLLELRQALNIPEDGVLGLFCGSLYPDKRLDLLVSACDIIHSRRPGFRLVIIGEGPSGIELKCAASSRPWMKMVGAKRGQDKAAYFKLADVVLNPGLVGLHVLDAFCAGLPMLTTSDARHSPEIAYLRHGINGLVCPGTSIDYANGVLDLLSDPSRLRSLMQSAFSDSKRYTLDNMISNFTDGIQRCLAAPRK